MSLAFTSEATSFFPPCTVQTFLGKQPKGVGSAPASIPLRFFSAGQASPVGHLLREKSGRPLGEGSCPPAHYSLWSHRPLWAPSFLGPFAFCRGAGAL